MTGGSGTLPSHRRFAAGYGLLLSAVAVVIGISFVASSGKHRPQDVSIAYTIDPPSSCLGDSIELEQSGKFVSLAGPGGLAEESAVGGTLVLEDGRLSGDVTCRDGSTERLESAVQGSVERREGEEGTVEVVGGPIIRGSLAGDEFEGISQLPSEAVVPAVEKRPAEETFGRLMLAIAAVILAARLMGALVSRIGQPRVMGEVIAGILLGPTLLGTFLPSIQGYLFPPDVIPLLAAGADIGLVFYMFLVGLELDPRMLRGRAEQAAFISHGSIAVPMGIGIATAVFIYELVGPSKDFVPFAVFMGVAMSITAFPVLARILIERRMLKRPVGALALGAAAVDDVTAWALLALAAGIATATAGAATNVPLELVRVVGLAVLFSVGMAVVGRRILARVADAYDEAGHVPAGWIAAIFLGVLLSAYLAASIPIAAIFGAFVMGLIMPRHADLTHDVTRRIEDFVVTVLLPLFFVATGLRVQIGLLDRPLLWAITLALVGVAVSCKWAGAMLAARFTGIGWRESAALGCLMNTRGLTELIVLNIGLDLGVITPALFTMLVIMALVTTFMTGPALRLIDRRGEMTAPPEEELRSAARVTEPEGMAPQRSILVAPQDEKNLEALLALAEPLAGSEPPRELILARLLTPSRAVTGLALEERDLAQATAELQDKGVELVGRGRAARTVAFFSPNPGEDLLRLTSEQEIDLILLDGRRPLLGEGVPRGPVGALLDAAPCDVAVLVEREERLPEIGPERPVMVPFGGSEHDWAALELAAWIASMTAAPLILLGAEADLQEGKRDASRLLANASLVVQQLAGLAARPMLVEPGREGILRAASDAALLVLGLSDRWRHEGLGVVRSAIAKAAPAPILFVRRGLRPGALAPPEDLTRFTWSSTGPVPGA